MGFTPVVGLLTADQVADVNDFAAAANLVQEGRTDASAEDVKSFAPLVAGGVGEGAAAVGQAAAVMTGDGGTGGLVDIPQEDTRATGGPSFAAVPMAPTRCRFPTSPKPSAAMTMPTAPTPMVPIPSAPPTPGPGPESSVDIPADFFIRPSTKAKAAALLESRADPFESAISMSLSASGLVRPAKSTTGRRPPNPEEIRAALSVQSGAASGSGQATPTPSVTSAALRGKAPAPSPPSKGIPAAVSPQRAGADMHTQRRL